MTEADAARTLVPMHWDLWRTFRLDPKRVGVVARWYCPDTILKIPKYGEKIVLSGRNAS